MQLQYTVFAYRIERYATYLQEVTLDLSLCILDKDKGLQPCDRERSDHNHWQANSRDKVDRENYLDL